MQHIPKSASRRIPVAPEFTIYEYGPLGGTVANGTVAEINGRYPLKGWGRNLESDEVVYVVSGSGKLEMPESIQHLEPGDVAFVPKGQKIAWSGSKLVVFIPCIPAWRPEQHEMLPE
jgi:mannose-6-phosphate isomerase-like protein (cupin superfamily)